MSNFRKGIRLENQIVTHFAAKDGWFARRLTAKRGMDVVAWNAKYGLVIECKNTVMSDRAAQSLFDEMTEQFRYSVLSPVLVYRKSRGRLSVLPFDAEWLFKGVVGIG